MSYSRGLGQAKVVPGQISFQTLPEGRSGFPSLDPLVQAGLPIAPYIEHGSWTAGQSDIMRYGRDPYRGIMGLGQTVGQSIRRLEAQDYVIHCDNWTQLGRGGGRKVHGMRAAMKAAKDALRAHNNRSDTCRIYVPTGGMYVRGNEVVSIRRRPRPPEKYDVRFNQSLAGIPRSRPGQALGQILTSSLCDPTTVSTAFQTRLTSALNAGSQAALVGGGIAGVVGAIAGKRSPVIGAVAGALVGWTANLVWTATHRA